MKIQIEITMDNAAFGDQPEDELSRILANMAERYRFNNVYAFDKIYDINGNVVGKAVVTE